MLMPGRSGSLIQGEWIEGGNAVLANLTVDDRTGNQPIEYVATESIEFLSGFESGDGDAFVAYIDPEATIGSGSEGSGLYRYGFNGKENDNDVKGEGNQQDYGMRIYDVRIGKFLSLDPLYKDYAELTPYQFASNRPIDGSDLDGLEWDLRTVDNQLRIKAQVMLAPPKPNLSTWKKSMTERWRDSDNIFARITYEGANGLYTLPQQLTASIRNEDYITNIGGNQHRAHGIWDEKKRVNNFVNGATFFVPGGSEAQSLKGFMLADDLMRIGMKSGDNLIKSAYETALEGGKHAGFLKNYQERQVKEIENAINSLMNGKRGINVHLDKISNPNKYVENWLDLKPNHQESLIKGWNEEIVNATEQINILEQIKKTK